jgi:hypothetical protein
VRALCHSGCSCWCCWCCWCCAIAAAAADHSFVFYFSSAPASGRLQCIGSNQHLKDRFGKGYAMDISLKPPGRVTFMRLWSVVRSVALADKRTRTWHDEDDIMEVRRHRASASFAKQAKQPGGQANQPSKQATTCRSAAFFRSWREIVRGARTAAALALASPRHVTLLLGCFKNLAGWAVLLARLRLSPPFGSICRRQTTFRKSW